VGADRLRRVRRARRRVRSPAPQNESSSRFENLTPTDCIEDGEDPLLMLLQVVWSDHDWAESAMLARLNACPRCLGSTSGCPECGSTGLPTEARRELLASDTLAKVAFEGV
jgi:hypothetical protein